MNFNSVFHPEEKWKDKKLTELCPCNECKIYQEYDFISKMGSIAERQYTELPNSCKTCINKINWEIDCMQKLRWYENNDERLKT